LIDLLKINCVDIITNPILNSTADNVKKKNVKDVKLTLLYVKPNNKEIAYNVIHKNSAVRTKCNEVLILTTIDINIRKKIKSKKLKSLNNIKLVIPTSRE
jgi:uncharacterized protein (DUF111 family)